jgi:cytochrome c peroxidase
MRFGGRLVRFARFALRAVATGVALAVALIWLGVWHPNIGGGARVAAPVDVPRGIAPLDTVPVPKPQNLGEFIKNQSAGVALGKALFWDMQVGSDGVTACATCHFDAGADSRSKNQLNPRIGPFVHKPNYQLTASDFPFHKLADPADRNSQVLSDTDEVSGSAGLVPRNFVGVVPGSAVEQSTPSAPDQTFNVGGVNVRRATGRNAPSVINAVFNFRNFWDGRAQNEFNGVDPFGMRDPNAKVAQVVKGKEQLVSLTADCVKDNGIPQPRGPLCLTNSSLASQAVGPPPNDVEMSADGRTIKDIGKKLAPSRDVGRKVLALRPLGRQQVSPTDSVLGGYARDGGAQLGLGVSYSTLIKQAFWPRWWNSQKIVRVDPVTGQPIFAPYPKRPLAANEYPLTEYNFSLFFGLAIQMYESTLVSDQAPIDHFAAGDTSALTQQQQDGMALFEGKGGCANCHGGPEFTNASVQNVVDQPIETMTMGDGQVATYDNGFYNIGVRPTDPESVRPPGTDIGIGANDPFGNPLSMTLLGATAARVAVAGSFKAPDLRNVALTPPYFHNGGQLTLGQVVDFYNRGGDFHERNIETLDPDIQTLGLTSEEKDALVAFLNALTDDRVRLQQAPFDHPQLFVPDGERGDTNSVATDANGTAIDDFFELPAVGAAGGAPLPPFPTPHTTAPPAPTDVEPVAAPAPASVDLGTVKVGKIAGAPVVINSIGAGSLAVSGTRIEGSGAADFSVAASTCGTSLMPRDASCTITVRFQPHAPGTSAAQLVVADNAVDSPLRIDLTGTGS